VLLLRILNSLVSLVFSNLFAGLRSSNVLNIHSCLLPTKFFNTQPTYLHNLISLNPLSTHSSFYCHPFSCTKYLLVENHRSFRYASPRFCNQLSDSFCQPHQSCRNSRLHSLVILSSSSSSLSASITPSLFHAQLKTYLLTNPSHFNRLLISLDCRHRTLDWTGLTRNGLFLVCYSFKISVYSCSRLSWLPISFKLRVKFTGLCCSSALSRDMYVLVLRWISPMW